MHRPTIPNYTFMICPHNSDLRLSVRVHDQTQFFLQLFTKRQIFRLIQIEKGLADDKVNVAEKLKFALGRTENIVGKGENAGYQHFLLFLQCFQKDTFSGSLTVVIVW